MLHLIKLFIQFKQLFFRKRRQKYNFFLNKLKYKLKYKLKMATLTLDSNILFSNDNGSYTYISGLALSGDESSIYITIRGDIREGLPSKILKRNSSSEWSTYGVNFSKNYSSITCSSDGNICYVVLVDDGLYTINNGTFSKILGAGDPLPLKEGVNLESNAGADFSSVYDIKCDSTGLNLIMVTSHSIYAYGSNDGGITWSIIFTDPDYNSVNYILSEYGSSVAIHTTASGSSEIGDSGSGVSTYYIALTKTSGNVVRINSDLSYTVLNTPSTLLPFSSLSVNSTGDTINILHGSMTTVPGSDGSGGYTVTRVACNISIFNTTTQITTNVLTDALSLSFPAICAYGNSMLMVAMKDPELNLPPVPNNLPGSGDPPPIFHSSMLTAYIVNSGSTPSSVACFKNDSKILCFKENMEQYVKIEDIRKGDLVKTLKCGYVSVNMIGKRDIYHPASSERLKNQLYKCSPNEYPTVFEDLIMTGCHSILVDDFISEGQKEKVIEINGKIYVTDNKYRLPTCVDNNASVYETPGTYTIYHLALDNSDYYMNYGI